MEDQKKEAVPAKNNTKQPLQEGLQQEAKNPWCPPRGYFKSEEFQGKWKFFPLHPG